MKELFIVDGYNIIFASTELKALANDSLDHAREKLIDTMANYGKVRGYELVLVFDAMYTEEGAKSRKIGKDCEIIFTDKEETAVPPLTKPLARRPLGLLNTCPSSRLAILPRPCDN